MRAQGATAVLVIEVWHDQDADGDHDAGEPLLGGFGATFSGPQFPNGQSFKTEADAAAPNFGRVVLPGIIPGTYTIAFEGGDGWSQTGLVVDGIGQPLSATISVEVSDDSSAGDLTTLVEFGVTQATPAPATPTEAVAGEMTPGPAATPVPPAAGTGAEVHSDGGARFALLAVFTILTGALLAGLCWSPTGSQQD